MASPAHTMAQAIPIADSTPRRSPPFASVRRREEYGYYQGDSFGGRGRGGEDREYANGDSYVPEETRRGGEVYTGGGGGRGRGREAWGGGQEDRYGRRGRRSPPPFSEQRFSGRRRDSRSPSPSVRHLAGRPRSSSRDRSRDRRDSYGYYNGEGSYAYAGGRAIDPNELEGLVPYRQFAEWFRFARPDEARQDEEDAKSAKPGEVVGMNKRFEEYKKAFGDRQLYALYLAHRNEPWFVERYAATPEAEEQRRVHARKGRQGASRRFLQEMEGGEWDGVDYTEGAVEERDSVNGHADADTEMPSVDADADEGAAASAPARARLAKRPVDKGISGQNGYLTLEPRPNQVYIKAIGPDFSRKEVEELLATVDGFKYLAMSDPAQRKGFGRVGWAQYKEGTDMDQVVKTLDGSTLRGFVFHMTRNTVAFSGRVKYTPNACNLAERLRHDAARARALAEKLEAEMHAPAANEEAEGSADTPNGGGNAAELGSAHVQRRIQEVLRLSELDKADEELDAEQLREKARIELDLWIAYLRNGLNTCYYCVAVCDYPEELTRRCIRHVRHSGLPEVAEAPATLAQEASEEGAADESMEDRAMNAASQPSRAESFAAKFWKEVDERIAVTLSPESVDPTLYGGRSHDEEVKKVCQAQIKQEEEGKFRCRTCLKLFKGPEFLYKHIPNKHPELFADMEANLPTFNNFALDPQRLQPLREQPASVNDKAPLTVFPVPTSTPSRDYRSSPRNGGGDRGGGGGGYRGGRAPLSDRIGGYQRRESFRDNNRADIIVPPPPPGAEDPRANKTRAVDYKDLDAVPSGDVGGLPY